VWWLLGVVPAAALALVWYMKSLVQHGSPLWPVVRGPWGDPLPAINGTGFRPFLADPVFMVKHHARDYYANLGGSLVLLAGGCALTVFGGRRNVRLYGLVVVVACLAYGAAPSSGVPEAGGQVVAALTSVRYLYPAIAVAAIALALAAVRHERVRILAMAIFGIAIVLGIERFLRQSTEVRPHVWLLVAGTAAGALLAIVLRRAPSLPRVLPPAIATLGVAVVAGSLAAWSADGLVRRQAAGRVDEGFVRWAAARDAFSRGDMRFRIAPDEFALLAGDQLQNHIMRWHVPPGPCSRVSPARAGMWLVLWGPDARPPCDGGPAPAQHSHRSWVFALMSDAAFGQGSGTPDSSS
jgi:hypothetical protein